MIFSVTTTRVLCAIVGEINAFMEMSIRRVIDNEQRQCIISQRFSNFGLGMPEGSANSSLNIKIININFNVIFIILLNMSFRRMTTKLLVSLKNL